MRPRLLLITNRKSYTGFRLALNSVTLDDLKRQNRGFYGFFRNMRLHKSLSFTRRRHRRQRHTRLWLMCIRVPMGRVQVICNFRNYNYWTGNAVVFRASRELCSNFLHKQVITETGSQRLAVLSSQRQKTKNFKTYFYNHTNRRMLNIPKNEKCSGQVVAVKKLFLSF